MSLSGPSAPAAPQLQAQVQEAHKILRTQLAEVLGEANANCTRIIYGGSVKPENIASLMQQPDVDGALVGGASLDPDTFYSIVNYQQ